MKQVAVFRLPVEQDEANTFLAKFPPEAVSANGELLIVNYDDQKYPDSYKAEEIRALMLSNEKHVMTSTIALGVTKRVLAKQESLLKDLTDTEVVAEGKEKYDLTKDREAKIKEYETAIANIENSIRELENGIENATFKNESLQDMLDTLDV